MNRILTALLAGAVTLAPVFALADDQTPSGFTRAEQSKMRQEADANKVATAKMTAEERAAAKKAQDAERLKYENTIEKITQNPGDSRNMGINKAAAASSAGPAARRGYI